MIGVDGGYAQDHGSVSHAGCAAIGVGGGNIDGDKC